MGLRKLHINSVYGFSYLLARQERRLELSSIAAMVLCTICWSTSGLFIKLIDWHPMVISCVRSAVGALFMAAGHGRRMFPAEARRTGTVPVLLAASITSAATKILYVTANKLTSPANAILLQHSAPVWAALAAYCFLGEKLRKAQVFSLVMVTSGIVIFLLDGLRSGNLAGDGIALFCGVTFALSMVALRMQKDGSPALALFFSHLIPVIIGIPFLFLYPPDWTPKSIAAILFLGLVQIGVASLLYAYAIKRLSAVNVMLIAQIEPVINPVWVFLFAGELPTRYAIIGGAIIIAAVIISNGKELPPRRYIGRKTL